MRRIAGTTLRIVCFRCGRERGGEGRWTTGEAVGVSPGSRIVSHGLCDRCLLDELRIQRVPFTLTETGPVEPVGESPPDHEGR